jgi:DHA2 family multidrug resistance protein
MPQGDITDPSISALQRALILITVTLVTLLYAMTVTIANVALPQMQGALAATQDQIAWVVTFNIVATAIVTPMAGWLTGRFGRRRLIIGSLIGFALASLLCGLATSLEALVIYRIAQGAFGAPLVPVSQAIVLDTYPKRVHGVVTAIFGMGVVTGPIVGPVLGGYLSEAYNWRWVFFMIVPFTAVAFIGVWIFIRDTKRLQSGARRIRGFRRPVGLRQDHAAAHDCGSRRHHRGHPLHRRSDRERSAAE